MHCERAYTYIDSGIARLGNAGLERVWSTYLGHSLELRSQPAGFDWLTDRGIEFRIEVDGRGFGLRDLEPVEWSEICDPHGAGLVARQPGPGFCFERVYFAFHDHPAHVRLGRLWSTGTQRLRVGRPALEVLPLRPAAVYSNGFRERHGRVLWRSEEAGAGLVAEGQGLVLGIAGGGVYALFEPKASLCTLGIEETRTLAPGDEWVLPETYAVPFEGSVDVRAPKILGELLLRLRRWKKWASERGQNRGMAG